MNNLYRLIPKQPSTPKPTVDENGFRTPCSGASPNSTFAAKSMRESWQSRVGWLQLEPRNERVDR